MRNHDDAPQPSTAPGFYPSARGLYDPRFEHDACGVSFVADLQGRRSHDIVRMGLRALCNLDHRGALGADEGTGDGAVDAPYEPGDLPGRLVTQRHARSERGQQLR